MGSGSIGKGKHHQWWFGRHKRHDNERAGAGTIANYATI